MVLPDEFRTGIPSFLTSSPPELRLKLPLRVYRTPLGAWTAKNPWPLIATSSSLPVDTRSPAERSTRVPTSNAPVSSCRMCPKSRLKPVVFALARLFVITSTIFMRASSAEYVSITASLISVAPLQPLLQHQSVETKVLRKFADRQEWPAPAGLASLPINVVSAPFLKRLPL